LATPRADNTVIAESLLTPSSFGEIFDRHFDPIRGYLHRQVGADMADDLASQTFLTAFDRRSSFDLGQTSARPWLFGIAANLVRGHLREVRRRLRAYDRVGLDPPHDDLDGIEERADAAVSRSRLAAALAELPAEELEALLLYAWAELSYGEVAEALAVPVGTVSSRLNRVRARLRGPLDGGQGEMPALGGSR
jgi:RNA polymerase sigma-70 factor (ECF subfamily)